MTLKRQQDFRLDVSSVVLQVPFLIVPFVTINPMATSLTYQFAIGISAAMAIYIMLRMGLLSFMVPAFMAVGGYAGAMLAKSGTTDLLLMMAVAFIVPALIAIPLGALVLRLKGIYFIFVTFLINEMLQLIIFETPTLTGGAKGITAVPPATLLGWDMGSPNQLVVVTVLIGLIASLCTLWITQHYRAEFTAIQENETLTESLGVAVWKYRTIGFVVSGGVAGWAGLAMVNMLATAHPSSFASWSVNSYIAYAFVGGRGTMLGMAAGSILLITMTNVFAGYAQLSAGLYGILLIVVMMGLPDGIIGTCVRLVETRRARNGSATKLREGHA